MMLTYEKICSKYNYLRICPICSKYMELFKSEWTMRIIFTCKECYYGNIYNNMDVVYCENAAIPVIEYRCIGDIKIQNDLYYNNTLILCKDELIKTIEPKIDIYKITIEKLKIYQLFS
jgi:hypothetical protein